VAPATLHPERWGRVDADGTVYVRTADGGERLENGVARDAALLQQLGGRGAAALVGQRDEEMFGADELVLETVGFGLGLIGDRLEARRRARLGAAVGGGQLLEQLARRARHRRRVGVHLAQQVRHDPVALLDQRDEQMLRLELRVVGGARQLDGGGDGFAGLLGVLVDVHRSAFSDQRSATWRASWSPPPVS
jgi:hypothetical protein